MSNTAYINNSFIDDDGQGRKKEYDNQGSVDLSIKTANGFQATDQASDDYDPYVHRKVSHPLTNMEAMVHLMKVALGMGIFAMPNAFNHAGYIVGTIGTILIGSLATYCVHVLVDLHYDLCKWKKVPSMNYPLIAEAALLSGPKCLKRYAPIAVHVINAFLLIYLLGGACIYVLFMATNLRALIISFGYEIDVRLVMVIILVPLTLVNWVHQLKYLAPLSSLGNVITIGSFVIICYYIFREPLTLEGKRPYATLSEFPLFFSTVLFALEAIGVIMPIENEMKAPKDFRGGLGVLNRAMCIVVALYVGLGLFGYLKYGADVKPTITINIPQDEILAQVTKGMLAFGIIASHAIYTYVAVDIVWNQYISKRIENSKRKLLWEYVLRTGIVFITFIVAFAIPNLDLVISLSGALSLSTLGILFPSFLDCLFKWNRTSGREKTFMIIKNTLIGIIGLVAFVIGTALAIKDIIKTYVD